MLGPTGNLRAPTIRRGKTVLVGFNDETFEKVLGWGSALETGSRDVGSVEATSQMEGRYRRKLIHLIANRMGGEFAGAELYGMGVSSAPSVGEKRLAADLTCEEAEHGSRFVELLTELGLESSPRTVPSIGAPALARA
jgi:hypothetical protein